MIAPACNVFPMRIYPDENERMMDVIERALATQQKLVTDGQRIYLTPMVMPGEFPIAVRFKDAA